MDDKELIDAFLKEKYKKNPGIFYNFNSALNQFMEVINKPLLEINYLDLLKYLEYLNKKDISIDTKKTYKYYVQSFLSYCRDIFHLEGITDFTAIMPSKNIYKFSKKGSDLRRVEDEEYKVLTNEQIERILIHIMEERKYKKDRKRLRDFLLFAITITTGARISEVRTIKKEDINIEKHYLESGFERGAMKTTGKDNRENALLFFFPESLDDYLEKYIESFDSEWLFPTSRNNFLNNTAVFYIIKKLRKELGFYFSWHYFRRTIITNRRKMGIQPYESELLVNHAPSSVEGKSYIKLKLEDKWKLAKKFYPYKDLKFIGVK